MPDPAKNPASSSSSDPREQGAWAQIEGTWRPLHGSFPEQGLSVEWHDFRIDHDLDWGRSFHPGSLEICLNFSGAGTLQDGEVQRDIGPNQVALYTLQNRRLKARRSANSLHRFLTIELSPGFLRTHFGAELEKLKLPIRHFVEQGAKAPPYLEIRAMPASLLASRVQFVEPPVPEPARRTWYLGRVLEILAQTVFLEENPDELFCHKHQRTNRERVERVRYLVERDLTNPAVARDARRGSRLQHLLPLPHLCPGKRGQHPEIPAHETHRESRRTPAHRESERHRGRLHRWLFQPQRI